MTTSTSTTPFSTLFTSSLPTSTFTFTSPHPVSLSFPPRPKSTTRPLKRPRPLTDIDGENSSPRKKKRRLRLFLITSRLSLPFSQPATNIVDRGSSKIAVWAKQKALGRNLLRKAAILNRIRRQGLASGSGGGVWDEREQQHFEMAKLALQYGSHDTHTRPVLGRPTNLPPAAAVRKGGIWELQGSTTSPPNEPSEDAAAAAAAASTSQSQSTNPNTPYAYRSPNDDYAYAAPRAQVPRRDYLPLPPSPLGLSNYDAFDLEDDFHSPYAFSDDEHDGDADADMRDSATSVSSAGARTPPTAYYSDFSILEPTEAVVRDYDGIEAAGEAFSGHGFPTVGPAEGRMLRPPDPEEEIVGRTLGGREEELQREKERQRKVLLGFCLG